MSESMRTRDADEAIVQVVRRRRRPNPTFGPARPATVAAGAAASLLAVGGVASATTGVFGQSRVGDESADGIQVSADQVIKPLGDRLVTEQGKFMGSTVSPDGRYLAATSTDKNVSVQIFDLATYQQVWSVGTADGVSQTYADRTVGQEAPTYSPDGHWLWVGQKDAITKFPVGADGTLGTPVSFPIPAVDEHSALVGQIAFSPDGSTIYAALNGQNTVIAMTPEDGTITQTWNVGNAPRQLAFVGDRLYVTNEGGRKPRPGETTMDSYGADVPADGYYGTSTTGSVSVIDTADPSAAVGSIAVGLHPTAMFVKAADDSGTPRHGHGGGHRRRRQADVLFVANTGSDTVSVIDTKTDKVVQTIATDPWPSSDAGYHPNAITMSGDHLLVTLGRANAVAVYRYAGKPQEPASYVGLLPTDYYPSEVASVGGQIVVTNTRGIDARGPELSFNKGAGTDPAASIVTGRGTHSTTASLTRFTLPRDRDIARVYTDRVFAQNGWGRNDVKQARGRTPAPAPVPARIGDPSPIKHVFMIVKENRTYDQVYGDIPKGNGDPSLAQFGEKVTPNQHALANEFGLYDNLYDIGTNSAEGHNWLMQGDNPEYTESSAGEYTRSYDTEEDVLGHQRSGFLWTAVEDAGGTARNYGEFMYASSGKPAGTWQQYFCAVKSVQGGGDPAQLTAPDLKGNYGSPIPSLDAISNHQSPPYDLSIPDVYRYEIWKQEFEEKGPANFNMMWLSSDHTGGPPSPIGQVADNDLAVGRIVDTISHSKYWKNSAIFVVEDDSQNGADHVDGHRAPVQIISPYAQRGVVDSTYYTQITMVRTIEQILGAQPLNQKVAAATPMYGAFTSTPDFTPFDAVPNQVSLTDGVADQPECGGDAPAATPSPAPSATATPSPSVTPEPSVTPAPSVTPEPSATPQPVAQPAFNWWVLAAIWKFWLAQQHMTGRGAIADYANPEQMNRYTWYATHRWSQAYPGDARMYLPSQVPGAYIPAQDAD